jgi:hypothetical protein
MEDSSQLGAHQVVLMTMNVHILAQKTNLS